MAKALEGLAPLAELASVAIAFGRRTCGSLAGSVGAVFSTGKAAIVAVFLVEVCPRHSGAFAMQSSINAEEPKRVNGREPEVAWSRGFSAWFSRIRAKFRTECIARRASMLSTPGRICCALEFGMNLLLR